MHRMKVPQITHCEQETLRRKNKHQRAGNRMKDLPDSHIDAGQQRAMRERREVQIQRQYTRERNSVSAW